ncbi:hypothetical protein [Candidatus Odyssella thessalonicensis]|uniref:hypothetical protein n=1 Tax=Candidatus Odyssella thessalonicensis TaxID=84647 RepID=UPI000225AF3F|nr:hypothetical protein [Candidatus Odyssella thessalonicensis]
MHGLNRKHIDKDLGIARNLISIKVPRGDWLRAICEALEYLQSSLPLKLALAITQLGN